MMHCTSKETSMRAKHFCVFVVLLLLLIHCILFLPLFVGSVFIPYFVVWYIVFF